MSMKKKDLEIIYNLLWKNKPGNGGDKANMIGMYDIPATTLNWEVFKSYLLKNSGTVGDDVRVSYITDSNSEFPIDSQTDFQIALYAFRRKARMGDIVNLRLDTISGQPSRKKSSQSNDAETQFDNNETASLISTCYTSDSPPEWFIAYMKQFKENITKELIDAVTNIVDNMKPQVVSQQTCYHNRKVYAEPSKRMRRIQISDASQIEPKKLLKTLKLEGKLERKLEKLEHKTKKIKERKSALFTMSNDSDAGPSVNRVYSKPKEEVIEDVDLQMDAGPHNVQSVIPHLLGGDIYSHKWDVKNTGNLPWTSKTNLAFTWGSKALKPLEKIIPVPHLKPGEVGTLSVDLVTPTEPGMYECYWHFVHKGRRFGHWLGCQVIIDPFDLKENKSIQGNSLEHLQFKTEPNQQCAQEAVLHYTELVQDTFVRDLGTRVDDLKIHEPIDTNCSSDSDNQSVVSVSDSSSSKDVRDDYVVVPIPDCFKVDKVTVHLNTEENLKKPEDAIQSVEHDQKVIGGEQMEGVEKNSKKKENNDVIEEMPENYDNNNNSEETDQNYTIIEHVESDSSSKRSCKSEVVFITVSNSDNSDEYAYILVEGQQIPIPKEIIKPEYLLNSEVTGSNENSSRGNSIASSVELVNKEEINQQLEGERPLESYEFNSHSSAVTVAHFEASTNEDDGKATSTTETFKSMPSLENNDFNSHCSAVGSCFSEENNNTSARRFIFPQNLPGYEILHPNGDGNDQWFSYEEHSKTEAKKKVEAPPLNLSTHDRNPFVDTSEVHVPNFQQTIRKWTSPPPCDIEVNIADEVSPTWLQEEIEMATNGGLSTASSNSLSRQQNISAAPSAPVHILPETLVSGAVNVASSAINTARSVINMIVPQEPGRWVNGHWVSTNAGTPREANLQALAEMGFWNRDLNATLLARYNDDLSRVVAELVQ